MKIQIDTKARIIRIDETVKINEFIKVLKKLLPKEWEDFSLESNSIINWCNPITINPWIYPTNPYPWWQQPIVTYMDHTTAVPPVESPYTVSNGVYNIEVLASD